MHQFFGEFPDIGFQDLRFILVLVYGHVCFWALSDLHMRNN
jgi:hypothetical protein